MEKEILAEIKTTGHKLINALSAFTQEEINAVPFEGSWTAAQVGDHVLKSAGGCLEVINAASSTTQRQPGEKVAGLKNMFLDFSIKMESPPEVLPTTNPQQKETIIAALQNVVDGHYTAAETLDLYATCTAFEFPGFGPLTGLSGCISFYTTRSATPGK